MCPAPVAAVQLYAGSLVPYLDQQRVLLLTSSVREPTVSLGEEALRGVDEILLLSLIGLLYRVPQPHTDVGPHFA